MNSVLISYKCSMFILYKESHAGVKWLLTKIHEKKILYLIAIGGFLTQISLRWKSIYRRMKIWMNYNYLAENATTNIIRSILFWVRQTERLKIALMYHFLCNQLVSAKCNARYFFHRTFSIVIFFTYHRCVLAWKAEVTIMAVKMLHLHGNDGLPAGFSYFK